MGASFGTFLKGARGNYEPNTILTHVGPYDKEVEECLYHPTEHAVFIAVAYDFRESENFSKYRDVAAEHERELCRRLMKIKDVAQSYSKPYRSRCVHAQEDDDK